MKGEQVERRRTKGRNKKKKKEGKVMDRVETDNKKQKQMSLYHHLSVKGLSNA